MIKHSTHTQTLKEEIILVRCNLLNDKDKQTCSVRKTVLYRKEKSEETQKIQLILKKKTFKNQAENAVFKTHNSAAE